MVKNRNERKNEIKKEIEKEMNKVKDLQEEINKANTKIQNLTAQLVDYKWLAEQGRLAIIGHYH